MAQNGSPEIDIENPFWGDDWPAVRQLFVLNPGHSYLNHGSFGAVPRPVLEVQERWRRQMNGNPTRFFRREIRPALEEVRLGAAAFLGADPDGLSLVTNATTAVSAVLGSFGLTPDDEVLITDHIYGATLFAVERACADAGARLVTVPVPLAASAEEITAAVVGGVTGRTRLAIVDHVTSATARLFPVEQIVPALQARGVAVCVDAAHSPGMLPIDLEALAPDFWTGNLHKWAFAPLSVAPLYASAKWRETVRAPIVSWREPEGFPNSLLQYGSADLSAVMAAPTGWGLLEELGIERFRSQNMKLVEHGHAALAAALGLDPAGLPGDAGVSMRVVPIPVDLGDGYDFQAVVSDRLGIEVAVNHWNGQALLRICANVYNHPAEYERLAERLPPLF